jgi:hypothetical protein
MGAILILRNGRRVTIDDLSVTRAKYMRRMNMTILVKRGDGTRAAVNSKDIKTIVGTRTTER